jgi:osmotically-inducible protein OsmY
VKLERQQRRKAFCPRDVADFGAFIAVVLQSGPRFAARKRGIFQMQPQLQNESDSQIRAIVATQIDWEPEIISRDISIAVREGVVTLTGFVHSNHEKVVAERAAISVYGVKGVANDVQVSHDRRTDPEIARDVVRALDGNGALPNDRFTATIKNGHVTLDGKVESNQQRDEASACAHRIRGVRGVDNKILVRPAD